MTEIEDAKQPKEGVNYYVFIIFCVFIALLLVLGYTVGSPLGSKYKLVDSDCYMHLIRASDLYHHGQWYDPVWIKSNAPFGEPLHWSRPFDVLLLAGAIPGSVFVDFETALFWWGVVLSPFLLILALIALNWASRPVLSKDGTFFVIFLFLFQAMVLTCFQAGRPDHHSLLALFFILNIGFVLRLIARPFKKSVCYWAGAIGAMSIWISVESMVPICVTISGLGLLWILKRDEFLRKSTHYTLALFFFCCLFLMAERPYHNLVLVKYDSISIVYACILGLITLFWLAASILENTTKLVERKGIRLGCGFIGGAFIAFVVWLLFPKLYQGPFADVDPRIITVWFNKTSEIQSLLSREVSLGISVQLIGTAIVSFAFLFYVLFRRKEAVHRNAWIYMAVSGILFILVSIYQVRWAIYPYVILSIVMTELLCRLRKDNGGQETNHWQTIRNITITFLFIVGFLGAGLLADEIFRKTSPGKSFQNPPIDQICEYLNQQQGENKQPLQIMTCPFFAAEILYRTDYAIVATANTYGRGILYTYDVMTAETDDAAFEILQKRRTEMILLCPNSSESNMYFKPGQTDTFYQRLCDGQMPDWLKQVELPENLNNDFLLFEVIYNPSSINTEVSR